MYKYKVLYCNKLIYAVLGGGGNLTDATTC
jgi:hypothetical protein